jgi:hypothetical protein
VKQPAKGTDIGIRIQDSGGREEGGGEEGKRNQDFGFRGRKNKRDPSSRQTASGLRMTPEEEGKLDEATRSE